MAPSPIRYAEMGRPCTEWPMTSSVLTVDAWSDVAVGTGCIVAAGELVAATAAGGVGVKVGDSVTVGTADGVAAEVAWAGIVAGVVESASPLGAPNGEAAETTTTRPMVINNTRRLIKGFGARCGGAPEFRDSSGFSLLAPWPLLGKDIHPVLRMPSSTAESADGSTLPAVARGQQWCTLGPGRKSPAK